MKLWRKKRRDDGTPYLEEVTSADMLDTQKPILFIMHGADSQTHHDNIGRVIGGVIRETEQLLGTSRDNPEVDIIAISYDESFASTAVKVPLRNWRLDKVACPEAVDFAERFIVPLQEKGAPITLQSYCVGALFADDIRTAMIRRGREHGKSDAQIGQELEEICFIAGGNVSNAINPKARHREHALDFTSVFFGFANDKKAFGANPYSFWQSRRGHPKGGISVTQLTGNRLQVLADAPKVLSHWKDTAHGPELEVIRQKKADTLYIAANHDSALAVNRGVPDGGEELLAPYMERALRNAVRRTTGRIAVDDLFLPAHPLKRTVQRSEPVPPSQEDLKIAQAVAQKQPWGSRSR